MNRVRIKVCCIKSVAEARLAMRYGADALGLVAAMPSGPGPIPETAIAEIAAAVPPPVASFLLTSEITVAGIAAQHARCRTSTIQICDELAPGETHAALREALPGVKLVQVLHVEDASAIDVARTLDGRVDALLLDSGRPSAATKELGGTGRAHDWSISARLVAAVDTPVFLAGGLRADNVRSAIEQVRPWGIDLCSALRTGDQLDESKLAAFFAAARG